MSQVIEQLISENKAEYTKMWQIMDDVVKNKKYEQTTGTYVRINNNKLRCAIGALVGGDDWEDFEGKKDEFFRKYNIIDDDSYEMIFSKKGGVKELKQRYKKGGVIHRYNITVLNDAYDMSFVEFRDLFYEMGV